MQDQKIVDLNKYRKSHKIRKYFSNLTKKPQEITKMLLVVIVLSLSLGCVIWSYFIENPARLDVQIPKSNNITYNNDEPIAVSASELEDEFRNYEEKPVLFFIYTTWCSSCIKQLPVINEIAREFQNTDLQIVTVAIDRDINAAILQDHLERFGDIYFQPKYLRFKDGFMDFLKKRNINYQGRIPYTIVISQYGEIVTKFVGAKSHNYLRNKIIREIF